MKIKAKIKMKQDIYKCLLCDHEMKTEQRDPGETPRLIGCTQPGCFGVGATRYLKVEFDDESEITFIKPRDQKEWDMVREEIEKEIRAEFPKKRKSKVYKNTEKLLFQMKHVVRNGGLCPIFSKVVRLNKKD